MPAFNKILDTFLFSNNEIYLEEFHIDRIVETYRFLKKQVTRNEIKNIYNGVKKQLLAESEGDVLVRVLFDPVRPHKHTVEVKPLELVNSPLRLVIAEAAPPVSEASRYKFADRAGWDALLSSRPEGSDDVVLVRSGVLIETSRFNLFLHDRVNNLILTPELKTGCLNGVYRRYVLSEGRLVLPDGTAVAVIEKDFTLEDLQGHQLYAGNSVRGLLPAVII